MEGKIIKFINQARRRLSIKVLLHTLIKGGLIAFSVGLFIVLLSFLMPIYRGYQIALMVVATGFVLSGLLAVFRFPSQQKAALIADEQGLGERLTTALEFIDQQDSFSQLQKANTLQSVSTYSLRKRLPLALPRNYVMALALLGVLFVTSGFIPNSMNEKAEERHRLEALKKEKEDKIEEAEATLDEHEALIEQEKAEALDAILESALQDIKEALTEEEVEKAMERLDKKIDQQAEEEKKEVKELLNEVRQGLNPENEALKQELAKMDLEKMQEAFMNEELFEALFKALETMRVEELEAALSELAKELEQLSQEELEALANTLNQLASTLNDEQLQALVANLANQIQKANLSEEMMGQLGQAVGRLNQQADSSGAAGLSSGQKSQGQGQGQGEGQGQGSGQGQGQGQGSGQGQGASGGTGWNQGSDQGFQRPDSEEATSEHVYLPGREIGDDGNLTGQGTGEGQSEIQQGGEGLTQRGTSVDYQEVLSEYSQQAMESMYRQNIPEVMKDVIKEYFEALNE